jgi:hypothetical protein
MKSVAILLVKLRVWPATAPLIVENSPANEHPEIAAIAPAGLIVTVPKAVVLVHWL